MYVAFRLAENVRFIWKFRLEAPPSLTMGTLAPIISDMARQGRELEILIQKLEKNVLPTGATIISPGFINDKITNQPREVDILIEHTVGTFLIKIVIECRDRTGTQDTTWIEQLHTKLNDLNVHKKIAVSSSPFTQPALDKAKFYGIETRTLSEINPESIADWWFVDCFHSYSRNQTLVGAEIGLEFPEQFHDAILGKKFDEKIFFRTTDDHAYSILEIIPSEKGDLWSKCIENGPPLRASINGTYDNPQDRFYVKLKDKRCDVLNIVFHLDLSIVKNSLPISKVAKYDAEEKTVSHIIEFDGIDIDGNKTAQFIKNQDGSISLSFRS